MALSEDITMEPRGGRWYSRARQESAQTALWGPWGYVEPKILTLTILHPVHACSMLGIWGCPLPPGITHMQT